MQDELAQLEGRELESRTGTRWEITATRVKNGHPHVHLTPEDGYNKEWVHVQALKDRVDEKGWEWV